MGSKNSVVIKIALDRQNAFFYAGECVSGYVMANICAQEVKSDNVFMLLVGEAVYASVDAGGGSVDNPSNQQASYRKRFLEQRLSFQDNELFNEEQTLHSYKSLWRFNIILPSQLPPTCNEPQEYPYVRYYLKCVIVRPVHNEKFKKIHHLVVFPRIDISSTPQCLVPSTLSNHNRKGVILKCHLDRLGYVPGETITGTIEIENPHRILLKEIHLSLVQYRHVEFDKRNHAIAEAILPTIANSKEEQLEKFSLVIPHLHLPPSYSFHGGFCKNIQVDLGYSLEFKVKTKGIFSDFELAVPITLVTGSKRHDPLSENHAFSNSLVFNTHMTMEDDYPPPPYDNE